MGSAGCYCVDACLQEAQGLIHMYQDQEMKWRGWQVLGKKLWGSDKDEMRGQPHVRGSSTDGRNQNLIPRETEG